MAKRLGRSRYSQQQVAQMIRDELMQYAMQNNLGMKFVQAALGIVSQESAFFDDALNDGSQTGTNEYSVGPWQLNMKAHGARISVDDAMDPVKATRFWLPQVASAWTRLGGEQAFAQNPVEFQRIFHKTAQVSWTPTAAQAQDALNVGGQLTATGNANTTVNWGTGGYAGPNFGTGQGTQVARVNSQTGVMPPPATTMDAVRTLVQQRMYEAANSGDMETANAAFTFLNDLQNATSTVKYGGYEVTPEVAARLGQEFGITQMQIAATQQNLVYAQAQEAARQTQQLVYNTWAQTGNWQLAQQQMQVQQQQFDKTYGLELQKFGFDKDKFWAEHALNQQLGLGNLQIQQQRLELDKTTAAQEAQRTQLSMLVDLLGAQIEAGKLSDKAADRALAALMQEWEISTPTGYRLGYEPGGPFATAVQMFGGGYNPEHYRVRPLPFDAQTMLKAAGQFDLSKAWSSAKDMLSGVIGPGQGATPAPGQGASTAAPAGSPSPAAPGTAPTAAAPGQPAAPAAAPTPQSQSPASLPPINNGQPPALNPPTTAASPATAQTAAPPAPEQPCGPGTVAVYQNGQRVCMPIAQSGHNPAPVTPQSQPTATAFSNFAQSF